MAQISSRRFGAMVALAVIMLASSPVTLGGIAAAQQVRVSVSVDFRGALEPYGRWERHSRWGDVWIPRDRPRNWRPYTVGRWVYTEEWGWYWAEDREEADWGWATFHYGRWVFDPDLGWVWIPGDEWGPGFVQWRYGQEYVGWAPLSPEEVIVEYREEPRVWVFVRDRDFSAPRISRVMISEREQTVVIRQTVVVNQTIVIRDQGTRIAVNPGIPPTYIAAAVGRPIRAYEVRPRVLAGTARIQGAIEIRPADVRRAPPPVVRESRTVISPSDRRTPLQPLQPGEQGRLGGNPPKAALRAQQGQPKDQGQPKEQALPKDQQQPRAQGQPKEKDGRAVQEQKQPEGKGAKQREGKAVDEPRKQKDVEERVKEKQRAGEGRESKELPKERAGEKQKQPQGTERRDERDQRAREKAKQQPAIEERRKEEPRAREKAEPKEQQRPQEPRASEPRQPAATGAGAPPREKQKEEKQKEKQKEKESPAPK